MQVKVEKELVGKLFEESAKEDDFGEEEEEARGHCIEDQQEGGRGKPLNLFWNND